MKLNPWNLSRLTILAYLIVNWNTSFGITPDQAAGIIQRSYRRTVYYRHQVANQAVSPRFTHRKIRQAELDQKLFAFVERLEKVYLLAEEPREEPKIENLSPAVVNINGTPVSLLKKDSNITRIIGLEHARKIIFRNKLEKVKLPKKYVWRDQSKATVSLKIEPSGTLSSKDYTIYAERIESSDRPMSLEELKEVIIFFHQAKFCDFTPGNLLIAEDGIYFVDTEDKSFNHYRGDHHFSLLKTLARHRMTDEAASWLSSHIDALRSDQRPWEAPLMKTDEAALNRLKHRRSEPISSTYEFEVNH